MATNVLNEYISKKELTRRYHLTKSLIKNYLPPAAPIEHIGPAWPADVLQEAMQQVAFKNAYTLSLAERQSPAQAEARQQLLAASNINHLFGTVGNNNRQFILHVGPTNSGKTHRALLRLQHANSGIYLAPLRLLALEIFDTLNFKGAPCSLLTGEEEEKVPFAKITSSTIEMCDFYNHYDIAVIDECQMIADERRGQLWTRAILQLDADEIHLCLAPEAYGLITRLLDAINAKYTVNTYKRLTPLVYAGEFKNLADVQPGDALIAFSRKKVLSIAAELEDMGIKTSVIYGWLPPIARREEIRRFNTGESHVLVATDAIGMGVSLPIERIIFCETQKWSCGKYRTLTDGEIRQIAGRAGRYGKFNYGYVLTMLRPKLIKTALENEVEALKRLTLPFPRELITEDINLKTYLEVWDSLLPEPGFKRERVDVHLSLLGTLNSNTIKFFSNAQLFKLITCPFNTADVKLVNYWQQCCTLIKYNAVPAPLDYDSDNLTECEIQYRLCEIRSRLAKAFGFADDFAEKRVAMCLKINNLLLGSKAMFMARCKKCGKRLPILHTGSLCPSCELAEAFKIQITKAGYSFKNKIADIARFGQNNKRKKLKK